MTKPTRTLLAENARQRAEIRLLKLEINKYKREKEKKGKLLTKFTPECIGLTIYDLQDYTISELAEMLRERYDVTRNKALLLLKRYDIENGNDNFRWRR